MTADLLEGFSEGLFNTTLYESVQPPVGGQNARRWIQTIPAMYEAGVAEIYDYSHLGPICFVG